MQHLIKDAAGTTAGTATGTQPENNRSYRQLVLIQVNMAFGLWIKKNVNDVVLDPPQGKLTVSGEKHLSTLTSIWLIINQIPAISTGIGSKAFFETSITQQSYLFY